MLVWNKKAGPGSSYALTHELIIFCNDSNKIMKGCNIIEEIPAFNSGAKKTNGEKVHPTQKPIELFEKFILGSTRVGDVVLDTFAGSGTLALAAIKTNRNYICFELQDKYVKIATERIGVFGNGFTPNIKNYNMAQNLFNSAAE
jgi:site-specific DNA-methyltransferase (adenine-specific)